MTYVFNSERTFKDEYLEGLVLAYSRYLRRIPDASGVMSVTAPREGKVSVIIGGGSGHYPAFAGLVGPGLTDGAIIGDIFTSPSSEQAYRCIRAIDGGAGVLLSFGNYSGDVMNFGLAARRARAEGTDVRIVPVTDDVASAPAGRHADRRGIAGGFFVYRAAASAAHEGRPIEEVEQIARRVNDATFSFGVAFGGCTFPGRDEPLFTVARGQIDLGLGIHGEPGIDTVGWMPADELAGVMVRPLLQERPTGSVRAQVLLNGLGDTKYEELFVLFRAISHRLADAGVEVVQPEIGEFVTSLDMAGCSLSLCWLDDEIERLLAAPAVSPGFRMIKTKDVASDLASGTRRPRPTVAAERPTATSSGPGTTLARFVASALAAMAEAIADAEGSLGKLDSLAGDGDHGAGMVRGMTGAAAAAAVSGPLASDVLKSAALAFSDAAGGASGALWGAGLLAASEAVTAARGSALTSIEDAPDVASIHRILAAALAAVMDLGGARPGDKTMVDALAPFVAEFGATSERSLRKVWRAAAAAADRSAAATADLSSRKGRAAVHGDRTRGTPDPGAVSMAIALAAAGRACSRGDALTRVSGSAP